MNVTREVILDLLPVYLSGEASPATRTLVEEYMKQDPELAQRIRLQSSDNLAKTAPSALPPDLEFQSFRRTRRLLGWRPAALTRCPRRCRAESPGPTCAMPPRSYPT